jgi:hypothetical protein
MMQWTNDELDKAEKTDELQLSSKRKNGTLRNPVTIWVVRLGDELYVRCVNGRPGAWFRGTQTRREGHIQVGSVDKDVSFEDADPSLNEQIDAAYRSKYRRYSANIVNTVLTDEARGSTLHLVPR